MAKQTVISTYTNGDTYEMKTTLELEASFELNALHLVDVSTVTLNAKKIDGNIAFELQQKLNEVLRLTINDYFKRRDKV